MKCLVCQNKNVLDINLRLIQNESYRRIGEAYGLTKSAIGRHNGKCYADELDTAREADAVESVLATEEKAVLWAKSIDKMMTMADDWLTDPRDPSKYTMEPRADAVTVIYFDPSDLDAEKKPKRKVAPLQELLNKVLAGKEPSGVKLPRVDYLDVLLKAADKGAKFLDVLAKLRGEYLRKKRNPADLESDIVYLMEALKISREDAIKQLKEWHPEDFEPK